MKQPSLVVYNHANVGSADPKLIRDLYSCPSLSGERPDLQHFFGGKFGVVVLCSLGSTGTLGVAEPMLLPARESLWMKARSTSITTSHPPFAGCISRVIGTRPLEQMRPSNAWRKIAGVANQEISGVLSVLQHVRDTVGGVFRGLTLADKFAIPAVLAAALPNPAFTLRPVPWGLVYSRPELSNIGFAEDGEWFRLMQGHVISFLGHLFRAVEVFPRLAARFYFTSHWRLSK